MDSENERIIDDFTPWWRIAPEGIRFWWIDTVEYYAPLIGESERERREGTECGRLSRRDGYTH